jgi:hypothetical protein
MVNLPCPADGCNYRVEEMPENATRRLVEHWRQYHIPPVIITRPADRDLERAIAVLRQADNADPVAQWLDGIRRAW